MDPASAASGLVAEGIPVFPQRLHPTVLVFACSSFFNEPPINGIQREICSSTALAFGERRLAPRAARVAEGDAANHSLSMAQQSNAACSPRPIECWAADLGSTLGDAVATGTTDGAENRFEGRVVKSTKTTTKKLSIAEVGGRISELRWTFSL